MPSRDKAHPVTCRVSAYMCDPSSTAVSTLTAAREGILSQLVGILQKMLQCLQNGLIKTG